MNSLSTNKILEYQQNLLFEKNPEWSIKKPRSAKLKKVIQHPDSTQYEIKRKPTFEDFE